MLRDISELYASRLLSPHFATTRKASGESNGCCSPPKPPPSSSSKRLRTAVEAPGGIPAGEEGLCEGESAHERVAVVPGEATHGGGRETERPAGRSGHCGSGGDGSRNGGGSGGEGLLPSSRPLRVFVSQGDVVYVDEVEAVAIRGGDAAAAETVGWDSADGLTCGEKSEGANGKSSPRKSDVGETAHRRSGTSANTGIDGERAPPAFFDPLLNPGRSGGQNGEEGAWSSAVLLLVPLRLGLDELSAGYIPSEARLGVVGAVVGVLKCAGRNYIRSRLDAGLLTLPGGCLVVCAELAKNSRKQVVFLASVHGQTEPGAIFLGRGREGRFCIC